MPTMVSKSLFIASLLSTLPSTLAISNVTPVPLPDACSSYPQYNATSRLAGPWLLQATDTDNRAIEGFTDTSYIVAASYHPYGIITFPTSNDVAKTLVQCQESQYADGSDYPSLQADLPPYDWVQIALSPIATSAQLEWKVAATGNSPVKPFEHWVDGVKQEGVYLGGYVNSTTWGFRWYAGDETSGGLDYYVARLLGPDSADPSTGAPLQVNETMGFVRVAEV